MFTIYSCFHKIPHTTFASMMNITALKTYCADHNLFCDHVGWRPLDPWLCCQFLIQIVEIAQHTLFDFYLYIYPAVLKNFSGNIAAIRGHFFAIYQLLVYAVTNNFQESLLKKLLLLHSRTLVLLNVE